MKLLACTHIVPFFGPPCTSAAEYCETVPVQTECDLNIKKNEKVIGYPVRITKDA